MNRTMLKSIAAGVVAMLGLAGLIVLGSRRLEHFDAALVAYTFATLFAAFGIVYRYSMWLQRPPTALYWRLSSCSSKKTPNFHHQQIFFILSPPQAAPFAPRPRSRPLL
ncbi:MAG: hypothetical protein WCI73_02140, partial [Phycisphaerae bacterium]